MKPWDFRDTKVEKRSPKTEKPKRQSTIKKDEAILELTIKGKELKALTDATMELLKIGAITEYEAYNFIRERMGIEPIIIT